jgi:hypothetical protein
MVPLEEFRIAIRVAEKTTRPELGTKNVLRFMQKLMLSFKQVVERDVWGQPCMSILIIEDTMGLFITKVWVIFLAIIVQGLSLMLA